MRPRHLIGQGILILFLVLSFYQDASAAAKRPILMETDWKTGEIQICWRDATPGTVMFLYVSKWTEPQQYRSTDFWIVENQDGCHTSRYYENGQTLWYYVQLYDTETGEWSPKSVELKQTPPITAYIINWPDMLKDLANALKEANDDLKDWMDDRMTPSDKAMNDLQNAIDGLKDAVGAGQAAGAGGQLGNAFDGAQSGMRPPIGVDDGNGTYTGGSSGGNLPYPNQSTPGGGNVGKLEFPNPDSGTDNELTLRIPYMVDMQGKLVYFKIFTNEQMEKMKWLNLIRQLAGAIIFIMFGIWLVSRFSPQLKS